MYKTYENDEAVKEVQTYLHFISDKKGDIPRVSIDGIYGEETAVAVRSFQKSRGLLGDGIVDFSTFEALYSEYSAIENERLMSGYLLSSQGFPFKYGDYGNDVLHINSTFDELRRTYPEIEVETNKSYFGESTENSARYMQAVFQMEENGFVDEALYERMLLEIEAERMMGIKYD